jgi:hypothetical protein
MSHDGSRRPMAPHVKAALTAANAANAAAQPRMAPQRPLPAAPAASPQRVPARAFTPLPRILPLPSLPARPTARPAPAQPKILQTARPRGTVQCSYYSSAEMEEIGADIGTALRPLFGVEDAPQNPLEDLTYGLPWWKRWSLGTRGVVEELFRRFTQYGFSYHVGMGMSTILLGLSREYRRTDLANGILQGNCVAYSRAFATVLAHFNISAEAREVRTEDQGAFVTKPVRNFLDATVQGNIRGRNGAILPGRFLFTNHTATYVEGLRTYYDPMICRSYANFSSFIDNAWGLREIGNSGDAYRLANRQDRCNALIRSDQRAPGFPSTWQLTQIED